MVSFRAFSGVDGLFLPEGHDPDEVRVGLFFHAASPASSITLDKAWASGALKAALVFFVRGRDTPDHHRSEDEWKRLRDFARQARPHSFTWLRADESVGAAVNMGDDRIIDGNLAVGANLLFVPDQSSARVVIVDDHVVIKGAARLVLDAEEVHAVPDGDVIARIDLTPTAAGALRFILRVKHDDLRILNVGMRYFTKGDADDAGGENVDRFRYPVFALKDQQSLLLAACIDFLRDDHHAELVIAEAPAWMQTHFRTEGGSPLFVRPHAEARFVSTRSPNTIAGSTEGTPTLLGDRQYFTPVGAFEVHRPGAADGLDAAAPLRILSGGAGTEFIELDGDSGDESVILEFEHGAAYAPVPPWEVTPGPSSFGAALSKTSPDDVLLELATTAWARFRTTKGVTYASQSQRAAAFDGPPPAGADNISTPGAAAYAPMKIGRLKPDVFLPLIPLAGVRRELGDVADREPTALAASRIAPARVQHVSANLVPPTGDATDVSASQSVITAQGFTATVEGGRWKELGIATSVLRARNDDGLLVPGSVVFAPKLAAGGKLARELLNPDLLLAVSQWEAKIEGGNLLAMEQWGFDVNVNAPGDTAYDAYDGVVVFKFHSGRLIDVLEDERTYKAELATDPTETRKRVLELIAPARGGGPDVPPTDAFYLPLHALLYDAKWTGIVSFNAKVATPPSELSGLIAGMPSTLRAVYLAVPMNRLSANRTDQRASIHGLIDFTDERPLDDAGKTYDMRVSKLRVLFAGNALSRFECEIKLLVKNLFFHPAERTDDPSSRHIITFEGRYEAHGGPDGGPTYTFESTKPATFDVKGSLLSGVTIRRLRFVTEKTAKGNDGTTTIRSRISLRGELCFTKDGLLTVTDLFSFKELGFDNLGLEVTTTLRNGQKGDGDHHIIFNAGTLTPEVTLAPRPDSFLAKLPLQLKGFICRIGDGTDIEDIWTPRGFFPISVSTPPLPNFALIFSFDLGSLGALVQSSPGLKMDVGLGWAGMSPAIALRLPDIDGGEHAFGIEGVLRLLAKDLEFHQMAGGVMLVLRQAQLEVLGKRFPPEDKARIGGMIIAGPKFIPAAWLATAAWEGENFLALGQRLEFSPKPGNTAEVVNELADLFGGYQFGADDKPPVSKADEVLAPKAGTKLKYSGKHDWLAALRLPLPAFGDSRLDVLFNDPTMYGIHVRFTGIDILDLQYRKVADKLGMFYIEAPLPFSSFPAGPMQLSLPNVGVSIYTDGSFRVDLGFPTAMDFSRSFHMEMPPYVGAGGFYFAKLSGRVGSDLLPLEAGEPPYAVIFQAGIGFKLGYGKSLKVGPFSGSASICVFASLEGALGFRDPRQLLTPDIGVRGRVGIIASVSCHLDLVLTALDFTLDIWVALEVVIRIKRGQLQPVDVTFEVGVRIRIRWVIARFKIFGKRIEIAVYLSFEKTIRVSTTLGGGSRSDEALDGAAFARLAFDENVWLAAIGAEPKQTLTFHFVPDVVIGKRGEALLIAQLAVERSPSREEAGGASPNVDRDFDRLLRRVIRWAARANGADPDVVEFTAKNIDAWIGVLRSFRTLADAGLTYVVIKTFLAKNFDVSIKGYPSHDMKVGVLPVLPELQVTIATTGRNETSSFGASRYTKADQETIDRVLHLGDPGIDAVQRTGRSTDADPALPLAAILMQEYFDALIKTVVHDLRAVADDTPRTLDALLARVRGVTPVGGEARDDGFALAAGTVSSLSLHGAHIPPPAMPASTDPKGPGIYGRSGQMVELFKVIPQVADKIVVTLTPNDTTSFPGLKVVEEIDDAGFALLRELSDVLHDPATSPAESPNGAQRTPLHRTRRRTFAVSTPSTIDGSNRTHVLKVSPLLTSITEGRAKGMPLAVYAASEGDRNGKQKVAGAAWALRIDLQIRRRSEDGTVYDVLGANDQTRRLIDRYLQHDDAGLPGTLALFEWGAPTANGADDESLFAVLPPSGKAPVLCVMTNLGRFANPEQSQFDSMTRPEPVAARLDDAGAFLRLIDHASIVRNGGFTLMLPLKPNEFRRPFDTAGRTTVTLIFVPEDQTVFPDFANAVSIPQTSLTKDPAELGISLMFNGSSDDQDGITHLSLARPGHLSLELYRHVPPELAHGMSDADRLAADEDDRRANVQRAYRLWSMRVRGDTSEAAIYRRPTQPQEIMEQPEANRDPAELPDPIPAGFGIGDWMYRRTIDLRTLVPGKTGPYDLIGSNVDFDFAWRDGYGNDAPWTYSDFCRIPVEYTDRIIPVSEWPRVTMSWKPGASPSTPFALELRYEPAVSQAELDAAKERAKKNPKTTLEKELAKAAKIPPSAEDLLLWSTVLHQLRDERLSMRFSVSVFKGETKLPDDLRNKLVSFVQGIHDGGSHSQREDFSLPRGTETDTTCTGLRVTLLFARPEYVNANAVARVPEVGTVTSLARPGIESLTSQTALKDFAQRLHTVMPNWRLALGDPDATGGDVGQTARSLWLVRAKALQVTVRKPVTAPDWASFFAPKPLALDLVTIDSATFKIFKPGTPEHGQPSSVPLRSQDADLLLRGFLEDVEAALSPDAFGPARQSANNEAASVLDGIVREKESIAKALAPLARPLLERQAAIKPDDAVRELKDALRTNLRRAYDTDAIIQFELGTEEVDEPLMLYGDVMALRADGKPVDAPEVSFSRGRIWLCKGSASATLTTLVDQTLNNTGNPELPSFISTPVGLRITHVARPENGLCTGDGEEYERLRWLQLVVADAPAPLHPAKDLTPLRIPYPLRKHPVPPMLRKQEGKAANTSPAHVAAALQWRYEVTYSQDLAAIAFDRVHGITRFEAYVAVPPASGFAADEGPTEKEQLIANLVSWQRAAPFALPLIAGIRTSGVTSAAYEAYAFLADVASNVARLLPRVVLPQPRATDLVEDLRTDRFEVSQDGTAVEVQPKIRSYACSVDADGHREIVIGKQGNWLEILSLTSAIAELRIERNRELLNQKAWLSHPDFVYTTDSIAFGEPAQPVLDVDVLIKAPSVPATGPQRFERMSMALAGWLDTITTHGAVDLSVRCSHAFNPVGGAPTSPQSLAAFSVVPICFLPSVLVSKAGSNLTLESGADLAARIAGIVHAALPGIVHADGSGVLIEIIAFTHAAETSRPVVTLRGLWMGIDAVPMLMPVDDLRPPIESPVIMDFAEEDATSSATRGLFGEVVTTLTRSATATTDSLPRLFYPKGIELISLKVKAGSEEVELTVAGADALTAADIKSLRSFSAAAFTPIELPDLQTPEGTVAYMLVAESRNPDSASYDAAEVKRGLEAMKSVVINRLKKPGDFAVPGAKTWTDIIVAKNQFAGFTRDGSGRVVVTKNIQNLVDAVVKNANAGTPGKFAAFLQTVLDTANAASVTDPFAGITDIGSTKVTGGSFGWRTDGSGSPGGRFIAIPKEQKGIVAGNQFYTLIK